MKQTSIALALGALLAAAGAAQAADIQMYGRVDSGLRYTHTKDTGDDKLEMRNNRSTPRVGFNIVEDLGNGVKVKAYLENGFYLDTGSLYTANTLFDRRSILAVQGAWGEIGMGRMGNVQSTVSPYAMGLIKYDPFGTSYGQASIGTAFANTSRTNNAIAWISPKLNGWKVGVTYSLGDESDEKKNETTPYEDYFDRNHTFSAATDYTGDNLYLSVSYAEEKADGFDGYSLLLGADYVVGQHKVIGGVQYFDGELSNKSDIDHKFTVLAAAYEYKLAKTTWLYFAATQSFQSGEAKTYKNKEATEIMAGLNLNW